MLIRNLGKVRKATRNGRQYLVAPTTIIVPGVLNGSKGALYYPADEVAHPNNVDAWNGMPLVNGHPTDEHGNHVSARSPKISAEYELGNFYGARISKNGSLRGEAWFDVDRVHAVEPRILDALRSGKPVEVSTGLFTQDEPAPKGATYNGRAYDWIARSYRPDHLAILIDQPGACSVRDGCGVMVENANPEGCNQYTGKDCAGRGRFQRVVEETTLKELLDRGDLRKVSDGYLAGDTFFRTGTEALKAWKVIRDKTILSEEMKSIEAWKQAEVKGIRDGDEVHLHLPDGRKTVSIREYRSKYAFRDDYEVNLISKSLLDKYGITVNGDGRWVTTDDGNHLFLDDKGPTLMTSPNGKAVSGGVSKSAKDKRKSKSQSEDEEGVYRSKHDGTEYKSKDDRDSDDRHFSKLKRKADKAKREENAIRSKLEAKQKAGPDMTEVNRLKGKLDDVNKKIAGFKERSGQRAAAKNPPIQKTISDEDWDTAVAGLEKSREAYRQARKAGKKGEAKSRLADARKFRKTLLGNASTKNRLLTLNRLNIQRPGVPTVKTKKDKIEFLTANCDCWKGNGDAKTLNAFTDEKLDSLVSAAQERTAANQLATAVRNRLGEDAKTLTLNQLAETLEDEEMGLDLTDNCGGMDKKAPPVAEEEEGDEEMEDTETEEAAPPVPPKAKKKFPPTPTGNSRQEKPMQRMTMEEWEAIAPVEVIERDKRARAVVNAERDRLIGKLVANSNARTKDAKDALRKALSAKSLDDLNLMSLLSVNRKGEASIPAPRVADYGGMGQSYEEAPPAEGINDDGSFADEDDAFTVNTARVDWAKEVELTGGRKIA